MKNNNVTGFTFLWLALYAIAAFLFEIVLVIVENFLGITLSQASTLQMIAHWTITSLGWLGIGLAIIALAKKQTGFNLLSSKKKGNITLAMVGDCFEFRSSYACAMLGLEWLQNSP